MCIVNLRATRKNQKGLVSKAKERQPVILKNNPQEVRKKENFYLFSSIYNLYTLRKITLIAKETYHIKKKKSPQKSKVVYHHLKLYILYFIYLYYYARYIKGTQ